jgi:Flp pilus assembly protein TadD
VGMRRISWLGLLAVSVLSLGCWSKSGSNRLAANSVGGAGPSAVTKPLGDQRYDNLLREMEDNGNQISADMTPKTTTQKVSGAIKKASATVAGALTIKPKVHKAPDPLALDNMPKKFGVDLCYQAGRLAESNNNPTAAIKQYERGLEDSPNHLPTLISLARVYDRQDEFDKAEKLYRRALEAEPANALAHNDLGLCLARHNKAELGLVELRQAVKLEPNRKLYRNNLATVLVDLGRTDEAWTELNAVHPVAVAHYNLGYLLYHSGKNKSRALQEFTLAKEADASLAAAQQMLDQLNAETQHADKTEVAMKPTKVQCRIEDVGPQPTTVEKRTPAYPVAAARSPVDLRRTPPTESESTPAPAPPVMEPVPLEPADTDLLPTAAPAGPAQPPPSSEFPIRMMSGAEVEDTDESALPTPALLDDVAPAPPAPHPLPPVD